MKKPMKPANYCAVCDKKLDQRSIQLQERDQLTLFCSLECLVTSAVGRIRQRLEQRNLQVRQFARQQRKQVTVRHSTRCGRSTVA